MSSFDLGVWYSGADMDLMQATAVYQHINQDWIVVERRPEFDAFLRELLARFPNPDPSAPAASPDATPSVFLETLDELKAPPTEEQIRRMQSQTVLSDDSPWQNRLEPTGSSIILSINWDRADETVPAIYQLAARHGVIVYDPQSNTLTVPPQVLRTGTSELAQAHLKMQVSGKPPALDIVLTLDGKLLTHSTAVTRLQAHAQAREFAIQHQLAVYEVSDPASIAQLTQLVPISANDPNQPQWLRELPGALDLQLFKMVVPGINDQ